MDKVMQIAHFNCNGTHLGTLERSYIYKGAESDDHLNDRLTVGHKNFELSSKKGIY
jgi:hypothetical protein